MDTSLETQVCMHTKPRRNQLRVKGWRGYGLAIGKLLLPLLLSLSVGPLSASAETQQLTGTVNSYNGQTFEQLIQQAQAQARSLIEQAFSGNSNLTAVSVKLMGERNGQEVPLLFTTVSRSAWQSNPDLNAWTKYFSHASVALLGFLQPRTPQVTASAATNPVQPTSASDRAIAVPVQPSSPSVYAPPNRRNEDDPGFRDD